MRGLKKVLPLAIVMLFGALPATSKAEDFAIALESAAVRKAPNFFAPIETNVPYGTKVTVVSKEGAWAKIKFGKTEGWLHKSAFSKAQPILHDIGKGEKATKETYKDEVVTAGKGFSESKSSGTESRKPSDAPADEAAPKYDEVDKIESRDVPEPKMKEFMHEGALESKVLGK